MADTAKKENAGGHILSQSTKDGVTLLFIAFLSMAISSQVVAAIYGPAPLPIHDTASVSTGQMIANLGLLVYFSLFTMFGITKIVWD